MNEQLFQKITGLGPEDERITRDRERRRPNPWIVLIVILLVIFAFLRLSGNEASKNNPPASCQLFGGHWTIWNGWQCQ